MAKKKITRSSTIEMTIRDGQGFGRKNRNLRSGRNSKTNKPIGKESHIVSPKVQKKTKARRVRATNRPRRLAPMASTKILGKFIGVSKKSSMLIKPSKALILPPVSVMSPSPDGTFPLEHQLVQRLDREGATYGNLNFSLRWYDPNDLDLHVICPCGTHISYLNKKCLACGGHLDVDKNCLLNMSLEPVQHVYFPHPRPGIYHFYCNYFSKKCYQGVQGQDTSKYILSVHSADQLLSRYEQKVNSGTKIDHTFKVLG